MYEGLPVRVPGSIAIRTGLCLQGALKGLEQTRIQPGDKMNPGNRKVMELYLVRNKKVHARFGSTSQMNCIVGARTNHAVAI
jgi:hypothetical protein